MLNVPLSAITPGRPYLTGTTHLENVDLLASGICFKLWDCFSHLSEGKDSGVETLAWIAFQIRTSRINKLIFSTSNEKWPFHRFLLKIKKS